MLDDTAWVLRTLDRRMDRVRYVLGLVFNPAPPDFGVVSLPRPLTWLYFGIRPMRLGLQVRRCRAAAEFAHPVACVNGRVAA